jgi:hypothetical protein
MAPGGLKILKSKLMPRQEPDDDLKVSFLELLFEDTLNNRQYEAVIAATSRGLKFTVTRLIKLDEPTP